MNAGVLVISITATVAIFSVVLIAMIAINQLAVRLRRANRKIRLLHLWARERRADLARVVSLFRQAMHDSDDDDQEHERLKLLGKELEKQASYVGVEWSRIPTPASGFVHPEKLTPAKLFEAELFEMLDLSNEGPWPGRRSE